MQTDYISSKVFLNQPIPQKASFADPKIALNILKFTDEPSSTELVCRNWKDCTQIAKYKRENPDAPEFDRLSSWIPGQGITVHSSLSCKNNLVTIRPDNHIWDEKNCCWHIEPNQIDLFPFLTHKPFNGKCHLLGACHGVYVFQSLAKLDELMVAKDLNNPENWKMIQVDPKISPNFQKDSSFVVSEERMVLLNLTNNPLDIRNPNVICLSLKTGKVLFTREIKQPGLFRTEVNGYLFFDNYMIHLNSDDLTEIPYNKLDKPLDLSCRRIVSCGNSFYLQKEKVIESWEINPNGQLQFKWDTKAPFNIPVRLQKMVCNNKYIVVEADGIYPTHPFNEYFNSFNILDTKGHSVGEFCLPLPHDPYIIDLVEMDLVDDFLVYRDPEDNKLAFWHIPSKKCINKFWLDDCILDLRSTEDNQLIVLTQQRKVGLEIKNGYRAILFDLKKISLMNN